MNSCFTSSYKIWPTFLSLAAFFHIACLFFHLKFFFYLKGRDIERREKEEREGIMKTGERETNILNLLVYSSDVQNSLSWAKPEVGVRNAIQIFQMDRRRLATWTTVLCFPGCSLAGSWNQEWSQNLSRGTLLQDVGVPGVSSTTGIFPENPERGGRALPVECTEPVKPLSRGQPGQVGRSLSETGRLRLGSAPKRMRT